MRVRKVQSLVPPVRTHPWKVTTGLTDTEDRYFATFNAARKRVLEDLASFERVYRHLGIQGALSALDSLRQAALQLTESAPGEVEGVLDSGIRYRARIAEREEF